MNDATDTKLIAGNWKMNGLREDGVALARSHSGPLLPEAAGWAARFSFARRQPC